MKNLFVRNSYTVIATGFNKGTVPIRALKRNIFDNKSNEKLFSITTIKAKSKVVATEQLHLQLANNDISAFKKTIDINESPEEEERNAHQISNGL